MLFDRRCPACGSAGVTARGGAGRAGDDSAPGRRRRRAGPLCSGCRAALGAARIRVGERAGSSLVDGGADSFRAAFRYDDHVGRIVLVAKNGGRRGVLGVLAALLAAEAVPVDRDQGPFDAVAWVPASRSRARRRGYDQGRALAAAVARALGTKPRRLLRRAGSGAQAHLSREARLLGPSIRPVGAAPARVLLVDDVATTGASLAASVEALRAAGAVEVHVAVVAVVEPPRPSAMRPPPAPAIGFTVG